MTTVLLDMAISQDGYVAGPGGADIGLYDWYFDPKGESAGIVDEIQAITGAIVIGRGAYGTGDDAGWDDSPYHVPHFVVTHRPPAILPTGSVRFEFVDDLRTAIDRAVAAAGQRWAVIGGGADVARQAIEAGLVDEIQLHVSPILAGGGLPLFGSLKTIGLESTRVVQGPAVTHLRYRVVP